MIFEPYCAQVVELEPFGDDGSLATSCFAIDVVSENRQTTSTVALCASRAATAVAEPVLPLVSDDMAGTLMRPTDVLKAVAHAHDEHKSTGGAATALSGALPQTSTAGGRPPSSFKMAPLSWTTLTLRFTPPLPTAGPVVGHVSFKITMPVQMACPATLTHGVDVVGLCLPPDMNQTVLGPLNEWLTKKLDVVPDELVTAAHNPDHTRLRIQPKSVTLDVPWTPSSMELQGATLLASTAVHMPSPLQYNATMLFSPGVAASVSKLYATQLDVSYSWPHTDDFGMHKEFCVVVASPSTTYCVEMTARRARGLIVTPDKVPTFARCMPGGHRRIYIHVHNRHITTCDFLVTVSVQSYKKLDVDTNPLFSVDEHVRATANTTPFRIPVSRHSVEVNGFAVVAVDYVPSFEGLDIAHLQLWSLDDGGGDPSVGTHAVKNRVFNREVQLTGECSKLPLAGLPVDINFGSVPVGTTAVHTLTITNTSRFVEEFSVLASPPFAASSYAFVLPSKASMQYAVSFCPTTTGVVSSSLRLACATGMVDVRCRGTGGTFAVHTTPVDTQLTFATNRVGTSWQQDLYVSNEGSMAWRVLPLRIRSNFDVRPVGLCQRDEVVTPPTRVNIKHYWTILRANLKHAVAMATTTVTPTVDLMMASRPRRPRPTLLMPPLHLNLSDMMIPAGLTIKMRVHARLSRQGTVQQLGGLNLVCAVMDAFQLPADVSAPALKLFVAQASDPEWTRPVSGQVSAVVQARVRQEFEREPEMHSATVQHTLEYQSEQSPQSSRPVFGTGDAAGPLFMLPLTLDYGCVPAAQFGYINKNDIEGSIEAITHVDDGGDESSLDSPASASLARAPRVMQDDVDVAVAVAAATVVPVSCHVKFVELRNRSMISHRVLLDSIAPSAFTVKKHEVVVPPGSTVHYPILFVPGHDNSVYIGRAVLSHPFGSYTVALRGIGTSALVEVATAMPISLKALQLEMPTRRELRFFFLLSLFLSRMLIPHDDLVRMVMTIKE